MPVKIYFHYDLSILAGQLAGNIGKEVKIPGRDPFGPVNITIPINHFQAWLPLQISAGSEEKAAANLKFEYLEKALWRMLTELGPAGYDEFEMLDKEGAAMLVLKQLIDMDPKKPGELGPFRNYLYGSGSGEGAYERLPDFEKRVWKLSSQLAGLLSDYEYHRQDMVRNWKKKNYKPADEMEACQAALYRNVFPENSKRKTLSLPQLAEEVLNSKNSTGDEIRTVHFFGFSELSKFHIDLLWRLGEFYDIHIYQFNVCREFWEDITTAQEDRKTFLKRIKKHMEINDTSEEQCLVLKKDAGDELPDNPLLKAWGKPGRELIKGYSEAEEKFSGTVETESLHPEIDNWSGSRDNLLWRLQGQVLDRLNPEQDSKDREDLIPRDNTIQTAACPDIYREVETVYNSIVRNMELDENLKSTDITVLVPDMMKYKPVIQSVFSRKNTAVPFNLSDSTAEKDSVYGRGVTSILSLAGGAYSRSALFEIFYNPCFMRAAGVTRPDVDKWSEWARALNIFRWADSEHKKKDTAAGFTPGLFTWEWGLKRLRLGRIMEPGDRDSAGLPPVYADLDSNDGNLLSKFSGTAELLITKTRKLSFMNTAGPEVWARELRELFETFLAIPVDRTEEATVRNSLMSSLDTFSQNAAAAGISPSFGVVSEVIKGGLADIGGRMGTYGAGGVTVASIQNARPIPYQVVYILGLEEKSFPADAVRSTLDLRTRSRRIGDVDPREHGLFRFLEAFMSARKKLYLTYIGRDLQKDEIYQPSSAVKQLLYCMDAILQEPGPFEGQIDLGVKYMALNMPLHGFSERYLDEVPDYLDLAVNYSDADREFISHLAGTKEQTDVTIVPRHDEEKTSSQELRGPEPVKQVKIIDLRRFLLNPAEGQVRYHLRMSEDTADDTSDIENEHFFSVYPADYAIPAEALNICLRQSLQGGSPDVSGECGILYESYHARGAVADSAFKGVDLKQLTGKAQKLWTQYRKLRDKMDTTLTYHGHASLGPSWKEQALELEPVKLDLDGRVVEITGGLDNVWMNTGREKTECLTWKLKGSVSPDHHLDTFLFHTAVMAAGREVPGECFTYDITAKGAGRLHHAWESREQGETWLKQLVRDFLFRKSYDWLPWSVVSKIAEGGTGEDPDEFYRMVESNVHEKLNDRFSSLTYLEQLYLTEINVPDDALEIYRSRLTPLSNFSNLDARRKKK